MLDLFANLSLRRFSEAQLGISFIHLASVWPRNYFTCRFAFQRRYVRAEYFSNAPPLWSQMAENSWRHVHYGLIA